jgi:hypothetical protein
VNPENFLLQEHEQAGSSPNAGQSHECRAGLACRKKAADDAPFHILLFKLRLRYILHKFYHVPSHEQPDGKFISALLSLNCIPMLSVANNQYV